MSSSTDTESWREGERRAQQAALPGGRIAVSCSAARGSGGLGRHSQELEEAVRRAGGEPLSIVGDPERLAAMRRLVRFSPPWRAWADCVAYDRYAAARLPAEAEHLIAFNGESLAQIERAGARTAMLVSANSHLRKVRRQHELARKRYPLERAWSGHLLKRNLKEYERAETILCSTRYIAESFVEEGIPEERLVRFPLIPDPRFAPGPREPGSRFEIIYLGTLTVAKGVPLLIDAFRRLPHEDLALTLIGGWGTRGMRRFVQRACAADSRIAVSPGDPLPHMRRARLCVHPTYEDGYAYAPAEALLAGLPLLVSQDTGMKELLTEGVNGVVLPTGDQDALSEAIEAAYRGEILAG